MELADIKRMRKQHNLTQTQLAKLAGVSQSLIAKIESGRIDPSFTKVKKITETLDSLAEKQEKKAKELMTRKVFHVKKDDIVSNAARKMKGKEVSQLPVMQEGMVVGLITEALILDIISKNKDMTKTRIEEVMQEAPPIISPNTPKSVIISLLRFSPIIIVKENGRVKGVITKSDVI